MRFFLEQKIGQSSHDLVLSVFLSFFLHAALIVITLILSTMVSRKVYVPPFYEVKLVGQPAVTPPASAPPSAPPVAKPEPAPVEQKPQPKPKTAEVKPAVKTFNKGDMPELSQKKTKPARDEDTRPAKTEQVRTATAEQARPAPTTQAPAPNVPAATAGAGSGTEGVTFTSSPGDSKFSPFLLSIAGKIQRNWKYPEGSAGRQVTVFFKVDRTGKVKEVRIKDSNADDWFERAAEGAIWNTNTIPMPEGYYKDADFTVVLKSKE